MPEFIHIHGARELERVLKQLPDYIAKRVVVGALRQGAKVVLAEAQARAPVGQEAKGRLQLRRNRRGKIVVANPGKLKQSLGIVTVAAKRTAHSATVAVSVRKAYWGLFLEFGTRKMAARPFLGPAFEATKGAALEAFGRALGDGMEKAARRLAGPLRQSGLKR